MHSQQNIKKPSACVPPSVLETKCHIALVKKNLRLVVQYNLL